MKMEKYKADSKAMGKELREEVRILKKAAERQGFLPKMVQSLHGGKIHLNNLMPVFTPAAPWKTRRGWNYGSSSFLFVEKREANCEKCLQLEQKQEGEH